MSYSGKKKIILRKFLWFILFVLFILLAYEIYGMRDWYSLTHNKNPVINNEVLTHTTDKPDETKPLCNDYVTDANAPRFISMPSINTFGCIQKVGIDQHGAVTAPNNIFLAGWFVDSVAPGDEGVSLIDGHNGGRYADGIFKNLEKLNPGEKYSVEFGDKSTKNFEVVSVNSYNVDETAKHMLERSPSIKNQLNLVTCTGIFDDVNVQFDKRLVVVSKLIE